jgi:hypothetical protein
MGIQVSYINPPLNGTLDLGTQFPVHFVKVGMVPDIEHGARKPTAAAK